MTALLEGFAEMAAALSAYGQTPSLHVVLDT